MDATTSVVPVRRGGTDTIDAPLLAARGIGKSFGATVALRDGDFDLDRGELVAVMGPSGSGKSTLLLCLAGILEPDEGSVVYDGRPLATMRDADRSRLRRSDFGFIFQFGQLVPELSAAENVALPLMLNGIRRRPALAEAGTWLATLGLEGLDRRRPGELSGGEAQRVAVARAMVTAPRVIFADEPTGSLDSVAGTGVLESFTSVARSHGVAVVMVTHEARVAAYADRAVGVRDGRVTGSTVRSA